MGDPEIDESWFIPRGRVASIVKAEMDQALASAKQPVRKMFDDARETLRCGLRVLDLLAAVRYGSVEVTPGGIIVRGNIGTSPRPAPVVDVRETSDRTALTAFHSWIPAGDLARFTWSWVEYPSPAIWSGQARSRVEENGFILQKPAGVTSRSEICLRVEGALLSSGGVPISVAGGSTCLVPDPGYVLDVPAWFEPVTVPLWRPDILDRAPLRDALAAHVTVQSITGVRDDAAQNTLVFFADWRSESPLAELGAALSRLPDRHFALTPIVVVPAGVFNARRKELEAKLAPLGERFLPSLHVTEDIGTCRMSTYKLFLVIGLYLGSLITAGLAHPMRPLGAGLAAMGSGLAGLAGARLYPLLLRPRELLLVATRHPLQVVRNGERGVFAALLTFVPASLAAAWFLGEPAAWLWDCMAGGVLGGGFFIRLGCVFNGCCGGRRTNGALGVRLHDVRGVVARRVPVQFMEMAWWLLGAALFLHSWPAPLPQGSCALLVLAWYGAGRFFLEPLREAPPVLHSLRVNQLIAALLSVGAGGALLAMLGRG